MIEIIIATSLLSSVERSHAIKAGFARAKARRDSKVRRALRKTYRYRSLVAANFNAEMCAR